MIQLDPKSKECIFLGYEEGVKGYRLWDPVAKKRVISRDVVFNEAQMLNTDATSSKRQGHTVEIELHEQRTKSADESIDGSTDEQSLEDPDKSHILHLKKLLSREFDMKDLGSAKKILGMEIHRDRKAGKLWLSSQLCPSTEEDVEYMSRVPYVNAVGCLMYAMVCTRPDISHAVSMVSRYMRNLGKKHWDAVKWIFRYLAGSTNFGIMFDRDGAKGEVSGFVDSDYAGDLDSRSKTIPKSGPVHPNMQHSGGTLYVTPYVAPAHGSVGLGERLGKFNGKYFKKWQQKMLFYLTTLNLARFLQEDAPDLGDNPDRQTVAAVDAWKHSDFLCKNYILNGLDNALYNVYSPMVNAKALWESLERKYKMEDAGSKKFVVGKFLDFKMVDSKTVISQVQEFQLILHDIHAEGMHKRKEMKLEDLIVRLRIEEDNRQSEKKAGYYHQEVKANVVEQHPSAYRFLVHKYEVDDINVNTIMETRNAHFFEDVFPYRVAQEQSSLERTNMDQEPSQEEDKPRCSKRARTSTSFCPDFLTYLLENELRTYSEAMSSPEAPHWKEAINSEIESIMQNHTWELVDLLPGNKPLGCK
ncbi:hypothetical protein RJ639_044630 [Escallonia herrerae]|uniref:Retroviral polymerase SH3-like domain-containing protein n=1 Tax=Escallonia herrerae TaxID=1293975 RepID=A0AA89B9M1_9ASTE|nr:hypothetical protein RJ639_044630 [Escallonia herrerae]